MAGEIAGLVLRLDKLDDDADATSASAAYCACDDLLRGSAAAARTIGSACRSCCRAWGFLVLHSLAAASAAAPERAATCAAYCAWTIAAVIGKAGSAVATRNIEQTAS